ncbi:Peptidase S24-like protein [compost metagenome]
MKQTFANRVAQAVSESGLTVRQIAELAKTSPGQVSQWQTEGKVQPENIKADVLEKMSVTLGVRSRWLLYGELPMRDDGTVPLAVSAPATPGDYVRVLQLDAEAGMGGERVNDDFPEVIRAMDFEPDYIRSVVGFVPPPGRLVLVTGRGDSMIPVIQPGESLMVDTGVTTFDGDGVYLINIGGGHQVKGLQHRGDAIYVVSANAALYPAFALPTGTTVAGKVYLRNRIERFN